VPLKHVIVLKVVNDVWLISSAMLSSSLAIDVIINKCQTYSFMIMLRYCEQLLKWTVCTNCLKTFIFIIL